MPRHTIFVGVLLIVLGVGAYAVSGFESPTAALPAVLGVPVTVLGRLGAEERRRRAAMHAAAVLTFLGAVGGLQGVVQLPGLLTGGDVERPLAVAVQSGMTAICAVHVLLAVRSFRGARRARTAG